MSQFNLYLERVQENRNYYYESSEEEYEEKGYYKGYNNIWRNSKGEPLKKPQYKTKKEESDAFYNHPIRRTLLEPSRKAQPWDGKIFLTQNDKKILHNIFIKTPITAALIAGLFIANALSEQKGKIEINKVKEEIIQNISSKDSSKDIFYKQRMEGIIDDVIEKAKDGKINKEELEEIAQVNQISYKQQ